MQDNREYHRTDITAEKAGDTVHIMDGGETIVHDPPESHRLSKTQHTFLTVRNIFVVIAGGLFILSMLHIEPIYHYWNVLKFVAYILGAGAYGAEVVVLTDGWRKNPSFKEMLMPYMFGVLYVLLGFSYLLGSH